MTAVVVVLAIAVVATVAGLAVARRRFVAVTVTGLSMEPTLHPGDRVLVRRAGVGAVHPGQVVVLGVPDDIEGDAGTEWMIKRAIAVPGDAVPRIGVLGGAESDDRTVPAGQLVVLGDNAAFSLDSRRLGYLSGERMLGVVVRRLSAGPRPGPRGRLRGGPRLRQDFGERVLHARTAEGTTRAGTGPVL